MRGGEKTEERTTGLATWEKDPSNRLAPMSHRNQCQICGCFRTKRFYRARSVWYTRDYASKKKKAPRSMFCCLECYKELHAHGPEPREDPSFWATLDDLASAVELTRPAPVRDDWRYHDDIEQMTAEEHCFRISYDFLPRLEAMTISASYQERYERDRSLRLSIEQYKAIGGGLGAR